MSPNIDGQVYGNKLIQDIKLNTKEFTIETNKI